MSARGLKRSVSFVIRHRDRPGVVLAVRRPSDDEDLPDAWGLPAGSLREGESWADAVRRAGREKMGVELEVGDVLEEGSIERASYTLHMRMYEASVVGGVPSVPQASADVTQYGALDWASADVFVPAAQAGSLCCRLYLRHAGREGAR
ncbi:MAG TPA: NUDIX hydrolase [Longimicrobiales bacterium]